jgi:DNA-binding transcriptional ArsR family regulator
MTAVPDPPRVHLDRAALRMLAHPLRSRLLAELRQYGAATATSLAARLQTNSGATSYHLRKLAEVGVVEDNGEGTGRARIWTASTSGRPRGEDAEEDAGQDGDDDATSPTGPTPGSTTRSSGRPRGARPPACQTTWCR